ncbi:hypothetical protein [Aquitalea palustris]|uniref:hypothetical protein n=1 Tax=Aquitalea palustris TaxID=2480983 RepID=UPI001314F93E|nr:hypothetical protein [Aquitalea palustris]
MAPETLHQVRGLHDDPDIGRGCPVWKWSSIINVAVFLTLPLKLKPSHSLPGVAAKP